MRVLPDAPMSWACGSTRIAEGPDSESGSLGGASPFMPTSLRSERSQSKTAAPKRGSAEAGFTVCVFASFGAASHFAATGLSGNSRPPRLKIAEPSGCKSRVADRRVVNREQQTGSTQDRTALGVQVSPRRPIWNVNRTSEPDLFAKQWAPRTGSVVRVHGIPPFTRA